MDFGDTVCSLCLRPDFRTSLNLKFPQPCSGQFCISRRRPIKGHLLLKDNVIYLPLTCGIIFLTSFKILVKINIFFQRIMCVYECVCACVVLIIPDVINEYL